MCRDDDVWMLKRMQQSWFSPRGQERELAGGIKERAGLLFSQTLGMLARKLFLGGMGRVGLGKDFWALPQACLQLLAKVSRPNREAKSIQVAEKQGEK
jgi:hypothetical protein